LLASSIRPLKGRTLAPRGGKSQGQVNPLIHGARAALCRAGGKQDPKSRWLAKLRERRHPNIVAVALANKNARIAWALLSGNEAYDPGLTVGAA
jgi:transposase